MLTRRASLAPWPRPWPPGSPPGGEAAPRPPLRFLRRMVGEPAYKGIPVIIISTEGREEDAIRALKMGAKGYIKKPFQEIELHALIKRVAGT